jgi:hypothetical protein
MSRNIGNICSFWECSKPTSKDITIPLCFSSGRICFLGAAMTSKDQIGTHDDGKKVGRKDTRRPPNNDVEKDSRINGAERTGPTKWDRELMNDAGRAQDQRED